MKDGHISGQLRYWPKLVKTRKGAYGETLIRIPVKPGQYFKMYYDPDESVVVFRKVYDNNPTDSGEDDD